MSFSRRKFIAGFATCLCCASAAQAESAHWTYDGAADWGKKDAAAKACALGGEQSPIDLAGAIKADVEVPKPVWKAAAAQVVNNGHTIQVDVAPGSSVTVGGVAYELKQYHFHTPSEHALAGKRTAMEVHFVHAAANGSLLVIGAFFAPGATNDAFAAVMAAAPAKEGKAPLAALDMTKMLPAKSGLFRYEGSLTTPPCSEIVAWNVFDTPVEVAQADIDKFKQLYKMNARPLQARGRRMLLRA